MNTDQLYTILADYSNDLNRLKKRDGQLPAQAAVERIEAIIDEAKTEAYKKGRIDEAITCEKARRHA